MHSLQWLQQCIIYSFYTNAFTTVTTYSNACTTVTTAMHALHWLHQCIHFNAVTTPMPTLQWLHQYIRYSDYTNTLAIVTTQCIYCTVVSIPISSLQYKTNANNIETTFTIVSKPMRSLQGPHQCNHYSDYINAFITVTTPMQSL